MRPVPVPSRAVPAPRTVAPVLLLVLAFLVCAGALLIYTADRQNRTAAAAERHLAHSATEGVRDEVRNFVRDYAFWNASVEHLVRDYDPDWADDYVGQWAVDGMQMDGSLVVDGRDRLVHWASRHSPDAAPLRAPFPPGVAALLEQVRAQPGTPGQGPRTVDGYFRDGDGVHLAVAAAIVWEDARPHPHLVGAPAVLLFYRTLDPARLAGLSERFLLDGLRLADPSQQAGGPVLPLDGAHGEVLAALSWQAARPGSQMLAGLALPLGLGLAVVAGLVAVIVYRSCRAARALAGYHAHLETSHRELAAARIETERHARQLAEQADELRQARDRARAADRAKSEFLAMMSHELRTPLNTVLGFADLIRQDIGGAERRHQYADYIHASGSHLLSLINDILDLSKIEAQRYRLQEEATGLDAVVAQSLALARGPADAKGVRLAASGDPAALTADPRALKQVLVNLLNNAVKFSPEDGLVTVTSRVDAAGLAIAVQDRGCGMSEADIAAAFTRFGQAHAGRERRADGTGLGLNVARALTELHGGRLEVASAPGAGTTVTVCLPADRLRSPPLSDGASADGGAGSAARCTGKV